MRHAIHVSRVVLAVTVVLGIAVSAWAQTTGTGAFASLSPGDQKIARSQVGVNLEGGAVGCGSGRQFARGLLRIHRGLMERESRLHALLGSRSHAHNEVLCS